MRRIMVYFLLVCMLILTACHEREADTGDAIAQFSREMGEMPEEALQMQKMLTQWYNLNLRTEAPDVGFERSYGSILYFTDGMMGYVEIPDLEIRIPIYHDMRQSGFFHDPYSAFPTGGEGNRTELHTALPIVLEEGAVFHVHVLGDVLTYRIGEVGNDSCTLICAGIPYEGTRLVED